MLLIEIISRMIILYAICLNGYINGFIARKISEWLKKNGPDGINEIIIYFLVGFFFGPMNSILSIILLVKFFLLHGSPVACQDF